MSSAQTSCLFKTLFTRLEVMNTISLAKDKDTVVFAEQTSKYESREWLGAETGVPISRGRMILLSVFYKGKVTGRSQDQTEIPLTVQLRVTIVSVLQV